MISNLIAGLSILVFLGFTNSYAIYLLLAEIPTPPSQNHS
ncbi:hypothetical protein Cylst_5394 [Cylindrospermum stagnale PCC 7417]|uniref:Uncharacterized protein n=1 Tax=Cylindrospermum stagnale PCC 7417 TaxID=56107 RepID=K9X5R4_9NOST|nr:hypothetical protein Cylst_5394 [Cylindrospermum stagnale PCC 7417]